MTAIKAAVTALEADGVPTGDIEVFTGEQGAKCLDLPGREHGRAVHLLRTLEASMGDERETNNRIDAALRQGAALVCVKMPLNVRLTKSINRLWVRKQVSRPIMNPVRDWTSARAC